MIIKLSLLFVYCFIIFIPKSENLCHGRFHKHLLETFAPQLIRYLDLMESNLFQMTKRNFEKEKWDPKGSTGCASSVDIFMKLNTVQNFIHDLYWPDDAMAQHVEDRVRSMACDNIMSVIQYTSAAFQQWERKGSRTSTEYIVPNEMCTMINVVLEAKNQSLKLCTFKGHDKVSLSKIYLMTFSNDI